jgi:hypothetical protein
MPMNYPTSYYSLLFVIIRLNNHILLKEVTDELLAPVLEKSTNSSNITEKGKSSKVKGQQTSASTDESGGNKSTSKAKSITSDKAEEKSSHKKKISFTDKK